MNLLRYLQQYFELIPSFPFVIQVALYFILFNLVSGLVFLAAAVLIRRKLRLNRDLEEKLNPGNIAFFDEILNAEKEYTAVEVSEKYLREHGKKGKITKKYYPPLISALEQKVNEEPQITANKNYRPLVIGLKIEEFLVKKIEFSNTKTRLSTFQTLAILDLTAPDSSILPYTHSANPFIRKGSRTSYVAISNNDPFKFFDQIDNTLNDWDSIALMQQIQLHHRNNLPNFSKWIKYSKNKSQLVFVIKAVATFNQTSAASSIMELLETEDHDIRRETINAIGQMEIVEAEQKMIEIFSDQPQDCQDAIIKALLSINSGKSLPFLKNAYQQSGATLDTKKLIAEVIYRYNSEGKAYINELYRTETGFNKLILEHIKNPLIPSNLITKKNMLEKEMVHEYDSTNLNYNN